MSKYDVTLRVWYSNKDDGVGYFDFTAHRNETTLKVDEIARASFVHLKNDGIHEASVPVSRILYIEVDPEGEA